MGIIAYHEGGWKALFGMFFAPHVIFEVPAVWISATLGMQIGREIFLDSPFVFLIVRQSMLAYVQLILPLLFIAGLIEAALINMMLKPLAKNERVNVIKEIK